MMTKCIVLVKVVKKRCVCDDGEMHCTCEGSKKNGVCVSIGGEMHCAHNDSQVHCVSQRCCG